MPKLRRRDVLGPYFHISLKGAVPEGYRVVGRERGEPKKKPDAMLKIRGPEPIPQALIGWKCPLKGKFKPKAEFDITVIGMGAPKRSYSVSCTVDKTPLAAVLP